MKTNIHLLFLAEFLFDWEMFQTISNSGTGESFLSPPEWLWGPHIYLISIKYLRSLGIKRPRREHNKLPVSSAQVMLLSAKCPLVLRFHLNEQQNVKVVRWSWTDSTVKGGLGECRLVERCWWRLVSFSIWCKLLAASSVALLELWKWRQ